MTRVLEAFNPDLPVSVACDAGPNGISGVLSHIVDRAERPIAFASRSLTNAEKIIHNWIRKQSQFTGQFVSSFIMYMVAKLL